MSHEQAGCLPLSGLTGWQLLVDTADVQPGQRVLVHAAAGGVGHLAVQIAKARGAYVIGTARSAQHGFVSGLGADELIDYTATRFEDAARDIDVVVDLVGGDNSRRSLATLKRGGLLLSVPSGTGEGLRQAAEPLGVRVTGFLVEPDHAGLEHLAELVPDGRLAVNVGTVLPLEQAAMAHELGESGRAAGKIALTV
jgi:NADPH:quinone reductase-like Zn-dependent oxidoreductase